MKRRLPCDCLPVDDNLAQAGNVTLNKVEHSCELYSACPKTDLVGVLLMAFLSERGDGEDAKGEDGAEQPHG